ncbi:histidine--tRNA ligase [Candidatus Roizmanbacteria bacterium]|nr:histidine--tRNA ligase [Candidatus Roizmanbacteria bacterium]
MKIKPMTLKGFRDFLPEAALKRQYLIGKIREVFELYGFLPLETPALEYLETFSGNIGEDEKLFFKFEDQGGRKVALRYDQTVPTCRVIAQYRNLITLPFKRYQIQTVWRAEKPQKGRYRELLQCDADIFGVTGPQADAEVIALTLDLYKNFGCKNFMVKINDRSLFRTMPYEVIVTIDKLKKIGKEGVLEEIEKKGFNKTQAAEFLSTLMNAKPNETLKTIFTYLKSAGFSQENFSFDPTIARSFNYSTGPIWEVVIPEYDAGSVLGGERYDKLVGRFQNQDVPATGFAIGFDRTLEALEELKLLPQEKTKTKVLVTIFSPELAPESLRIAATLRQNGIKTDVYPNFDSKLDKQLKYADITGIPYIIIIGPQEKEKGVVKLKNFRSGEQQELTIAKLKTVLSS